MTTPCAGQWALFDSIAEDDHAQAAAICAACPIAAQCLADAERIHRTNGYYGGLEGTWGGRLFRAEERMQGRRWAQVERIEQQRREEAAYTDDEARRAHNAYTAGERSTWARVGHKVYDRRRKRRQRQNEEGRAA